MTYNHPDHVYRNGPAVATAVPTPDARYRLLGQDADYVTWAMEADRDWAELLRQLSGDDNVPTWLAVPLVDTEGYLQWCFQHEMVPDDDDARSCWATEQLIMNSNQENDLLVVSNLIPMQQAGDLLCVAFALAAGWVGDEVPMSLDSDYTGWSRLRLRLAGYQLFLAIEGTSSCHLLARTVLGQLAEQQGYPPVDYLPDGGFPPHGSWTKWTASGFTVWYRPI